LQSKYKDHTDVHHYEDDKGSWVNGKVYLNSSSGFSSFAIGDVVKNKHSNGMGWIVEKQNSSNVAVQVSEGGFKTSDQIYSTSNTIAIANITSTATVTGIPVTAYVYENEINESKRRIKILKPQFVDIVIEQFNQKLGQ